MKGPGGVELVTAAKALGQLGPDITRDRIRDWVRRGLVQPVGKAPGRPSLFRLDDLLEAEHQTRTSVGGRPRGEASPSCPDGPDVSRSHGK